MSSGMYAARLPAAARSAPPASLSAGSSTARKVSWSCSTRSTMRSALRTASVNGVGRAPCAFTASKPAAPGSGCRKASSSRSTGVPASSRLSTSKPGCRASCSSTGASGVLSSANSARMSSEARQWSRNARHVAETRQRSSGSAYTRRLAGRNTRSTTNATYGAVGGAPAAAAAAPMAAGMPGTRSTPPGAACCTPVSSASARVPAVLAGSTCCRKRTNAVLPGYRKCAASTCSSSQTTLPLAPPPPSERGAALSTPLFARRCQRSSRMRAERAACGGRAANAPSASSSAALRSTGTGQRYSPNSWATGA